MIIDIKILKDSYKTTKRYLKVYRMLLRLNLLKLFAYRANLISSAIAHTVWGLFVIIAMALLTAKVSTVFGWTRNELLVLAAVYNIVYSIFYFLFSRNLGEFAMTIHFGRMDGVLLKPMDAQFLMSCTYVSYTHIIRLIIGTIFLIFLLGQMQIAVNPFVILQFTFFVLASLIIIYSFSFALMTLTIWFTNLSNLLDFMYQANQVSRYPQEMYKGVSTMLFVTLFPLTLIIVVPAKALLQKMMLGDVIWPILFAVVMFVFYRKFWKFALKSYSSASG